MNTVSIYAEGREYKRLLVKPIMEDVQQNGIYIPSSCLQILKGKVVATAIESQYKEGDVITFRKANEYTTVNQNKEILYTLWEHEVIGTDSFTGSDIIVVGIDLLEKKRIQTFFNGSTLLMPQTKGFLGMRFNIQCGMIHEMGEEAKKRYPELSIGDYAIIHHTVEEHPNRLIRASKVPPMEYRLINTFDRTNRDIFGKIDLLSGNILPVENFVFLEWNFDIIGKVAEEYENNFAVKEVSLFDCHDIDSLRETIKQKRAEIVAKAKAKTQPLIDRIKPLNPSISEQQKFAEQIEYAINEEKKHIQKMSAYYGQNFLLECKIAAANSRLYSECGVMAAEKVLVPYKTLYPITLKGRKYLITTHDTLVGTID